MSKKEKIDNVEIESAINQIKRDREERGAVPTTSKKILVIENGVKSFSGMSLKKTKGVIKGGVYYSYKAGTKWEDIDSFGKKNIDFLESDFN